MSKTESRLVEFESLRYNFLENHYCYNKISPEKVNTNKKKQTAGVFIIEIKLKDNNSAYREIQFREDEG